MKDEDRFKGYSPEGIQIEKDVDALQAWVKKEGWSVSHAVDIANRLRDRITSSPQAVFEVS
ncbi:MAG: hypothetical protein H8D67_14755 [Deltaproteobacteria bacterium]|nr:hypothetical protein [Deltaproteobacteria bacterium]